MKKLKNKGGKMGINYTKGSKDFKPAYLIEDATPSEDEKERFNEKMIEMGYNLYSIVQINKEFIDYVLNRDECFMDWLLDCGYINKYLKERFEPFEVKLTIRTRNYLNVLRTLIDNKGDTDFVRKQLGTLPDEIDRNTANDILDDFTDELRIQGVYEGE